jgi:hypothetical protein
MSVSVEVYRGAGDRQGDTVVDALIGSTACAISRGRAELDSKAHQRSRVQLIIPFRSGLLLGQSVRLVDLTGTWTGKIIGIQHTADPVKVLTQLTIDRPLP